MKYYIKSGDLERILSTSMSPKMACKYALDEFLLENAGSAIKTVCPVITVSEKGFRDPEKIKKTVDNTETYFYDIAEILDIQS